MMRRGLHCSAVLGAMLLLAGPSVAQAAGLRSQTTVHGSTVRLSDLFSGLQVGQDCDIGPSPEPGKRIVVPSTQLAAIAAEFGVDWQPGVGYQSAVVERRARVVTRDEVLAALKPGLLTEGASPDSQIILGAFISPVVPEEVTSAPMIQTLDYDAQTGRFSALLLFAASASEPVSFRVVGRAEEQVSVLALTHPLPAGAEPLASDLETIQVGIKTLRGLPLTLAGDVMGLALKRPVAEGVPLVRDMLVRPDLVERGRPVVLRLQALGLTLTAAGTALEAGAAGDRIHVINSLSHAVLVGEVVNSADVQIDPGTAPVATPTTGAQGRLQQFTGSMPAGGHELGIIGQQVTYQ